MAKREMVTFWYMTCDADWEEADIAEEWPRASRRAQAYHPSTIARSEGAASLDGEDDGAETAVIIATKKDGSDAQRYVVRLSISYDVEACEQMNLVPPEPLPVDDETGEVVKGMQDDATLPMF